MLKKKLLAFDYILVLLVFVMAIIGIIAIGSANRINTMDLSLANKELLETEFFNQIIWFIISIFFMLLTAFIDYRFISKFYIIIYIFNISLLILVLVFGKELNNVKRWLWGIQPSEFAKIFMIIFIATYIDKFKEDINKPSKLIILFALTALPILLIQKQPSLSASLVILVILAFQIFAGNLDFKYIKIMLYIVVPIFIIFAIDIISGKYFILNLILTDYQLSRITSFLELDIIQGSSGDWSLYQTTNSAWAIGSGQLNGKGLFNGDMNQLKYIPYSSNDFIFSIIGEEFGFIGSTIIISLMLIIILKCLLIAKNSVDLLGSLICIGVAGMLFFQTFINVGVSTGLLPNTGMPFPFISYGGSSLLINMVAIGLVLNISMVKPKNLFEI